MAEENEETVFIEHIVEIDNYLSATIKIPKRLNAIDLKALMVKANKMFNLSETPLIAGKRTYKVRVYRNDAENKELIEKYDKSTDEEKHIMAREMNIEDKTLYQTVWKLKKSCGIPMKRKGSGSKKYSDELVNKMVELIKSGKSTAEVAEEVNLKSQTVCDTVRCRTGKSLSELRGER